jgi:microcystin degradation protein MlrC
MGVFNHCGIDPEGKKILVVKSAVHFRAHYKTIAQQILDVETPALGCMWPQMLPLAHCRRPIYPLDDLA